MAPRDNTALLLQMSADVRSLEKSFDRANGVVDAGVKGMERRALTGARAIERAYGDIRLPNSLRREFNQLGDDIGRGLQTTSRLAQIALAGVSAYAIKLASDAGEIDSAFDVAFKGASASAREFSEVLAGKVGRDAVETRQAMTRLQLVLTGTGLAAEQATKIVKTLAEVGIDAGSLFNTSDAEAFQKIISGLSGEAEPLKAFGVVINDAALKAELLRLGFKGTTQEASEAAKSVARANLIIKGLAVAQGDAARTAGSAANQTRAARAEFNKAARDLGQQLLPSFIAATKATTGLVKAFNEMPDGVQIAGLAILAFVAAGGPIAGLLANLGRVIKLAKETRAAIAGIATANAAAGATGAAAALGTGAAAGLAVGAGAAVGTAVIGADQIRRGANYSATVKNVRDATDAAIAGALTSATNQLAALDGGPASKNRATKLGRDVAALTAEQARRGVTAAAAAPASAVNPTTPAGGFSLSPDQLAAAGGGKGKKGPKDRSAEIALRQQERADGLLAQATEDLARVSISRSETAEQRYQTELEAIDRDRKVREGELAYAVKQGDLTRAQAEDVAVAEEAVRIGRRLAAENARNLELAEQVGAKRQVQLDGEEAVLQLQASLARTAGERRDAELALLDLADQRAQADLDVIAATKGTASAEYEIARMRLDQLKAQRPGQEEATRRDTLNPVEQFVANNTPNAAQEVARFQALTANAFDSLSDGLAQAIVNAESLGDVAKNVFRQMIADLLAAQIKKGIASLVTSFIPGFASGTLSAPGGLAYVHKDELINLPKGSGVVPSHAVKAAAAMSDLRVPRSTRGGDVNLSVQVHAGGAIPREEIEGMVRRGSLQAVSAARQLATTDARKRQYHDTLNAG